MKKMIAILLLVTGTMAALTTSANAGVLEYGNENVLGTGTYPSDPKAGATLVGLTTDKITDSTLTTSHGYPFSPGTGDYPGTDQIYVGSTQTAYDDGYSVADSRINGPQTITLDYSSLIPSGQQILTLTLGIAADDFQYPDYGNPFTATINGTTDAALSWKLDSLSLSTPLAHFFTIGIDPSQLTSSNVLTLTINEGGDGGDGWAIDFLTVGVTTTSAVPEPSSVALMTLGTIVAAVYFSRRRSFATAV